MSCDSVFDQSAKQLIVGQTTTQLATFSLANNKLHIYYGTSYYYYYHYAAFNMPHVSHKDDELQAPSDLTRNGLLKN